MVLCVILVGAPCLKMQTYLTISGAFRLGSLDHR